MDDRIYDSAELRALWNAVRQSDVAMAREVLAPVKARPETIHIIEAHFEAKARDKDREIARRVADRWNHRADALGYFRPTLRRDLDDFASVHMQADGLTAADDGFRVAPGSQVGANVHAYKDCPLWNLGHTYSILTTEINCVFCIKRLRGDVTWTARDAVGLDDFAHTTHGWPSCPDTLPSDLISSNDDAITCRLCKLRAKGSISFPDETKCGTFVQQTKEEIEREQSAAFMNECAMRAMVAIIETAKTLPDVMREDPQAGVASTSFDLAEAMNAERLRRRG
jgi:hypothetical protein